MKPTQQGALTLMCPNPNKRPRHATPEMMRCAALAVAKDLISGGGFDEADTPEMLADDIIEACRGDGLIDGYDLARELDNRCHWSPSAGMVETLDGFSSKCRYLLYEAEKQWGIENPMEPPLPIGAVVRAHEGMGVIKGISEYVPACYEVKVSRIANGAELIRFEDAVRVEAA